MEKTKSPPTSDSKSETPKPQSRQLKSPSSSPPFDYHQSRQDYDQFASNFTSLYHSIFPPKHSDLPSSLSFTPSTTTSPSSSTAAADDIATEHRLRQARLILEYQELCDYYDLSLVRLQTLSAELESLRQDNADLRLANSELLKFLSLSSQAAVFNQSGSFGNRDVVNIDRNQTTSRLYEQRRNVVNNVERERVTLPKSISVRSSGYVKGNLGGSTTESNGGDPSSAASRSRSVSQLDQLVPASCMQMQQRAYVPTGGGKRPTEEEIAAAVELEVFNQGMWKTELCNKWQETGTCPYGDHCQFAHGIGELRPVIRHPRYKTQACRMVLAGGVCPYGHRCHFRHSLTDRDRLLLGPR